MLISSRYRHYCPCWNYLAFSALCFFCWSLSGPCAWAEEADFDVVVRGLAAEQGGGLHVVRREEGKGNWVVRVTSPPDSLVQSGVKEGDALIAVNGAVMPSLRLGEWIELMLESRDRTQGDPGLFPIIYESDADIHIKGFLKVEVVGLSEADATFRPSSSRREVLERERDAQDLARRQLEIEKENEERQLAADRHAEQESARRVSEAADKLAREEADAKKRADEAAAASAIQAKQSNAQMRQEGKEFVYLVTFSEVGPMGITFDLSGTQGTYVADIAPGSAAHGLGVTVGDQLVEVNGIDTSEVGPDVATRRLLEAEWPRVLALRVPEKEKPKEAQRLWLTIHEPAILVGEHELRTALEWGGNRTDAGCPSLPLVTVLPDTACHSSPGSLSSPVLSPPLGADGGGNEVAALVLVRRGNCAFVEKAANVQQLLGTAVSELSLSAAIIVNNQDEFADMPAGNLDTKEILMTVCMALPDIGSQIESILRIGVPIRASLASPGTCAAKSVAATPPNAMIRPPEDHGGSFTLLSSLDSEQFPYHLAKFGSAAPSGAFDLVVADPPDACHAAAFRTRVAGKFVMAERGGCSFALKAFAAQQGGAKGLIITNSDDTTMRVQVTEDEAKDITLPVAVVPKAAWTWATHQQQLARKESMDFVGRLFPLPYYPEVSE